MMEEASNGIKFKVGKPSKVYGRADKVCASPLLQLCRYQHGQ